MSDQAVVEENPVDIENEKIDSLIEAHDPAAPLREQTLTWDMGNNDVWQRTYTQKPLSAFPKIQFTKLLSETIKDILDGDGDNGQMTVGELLGGITGTDITGMTSVDTIMQAILRIAEYAPDLFKQVFMISWNVPRSEREIVSAILDEPHDPKTSQGGLTDDDFEEILATFIQQNAKALADFFSVRGPRILKMAVELVQSAQSAGKDSSKPSKVTRRRTPKA